MTEYLKMLLAHEKILLEKLELMDGSELKGRYIEYHKGRRDTYDMLLAISIGLRGADDNL